MVGESGTGMFLQNECLLKNILAVTCMKIEDKPRLPPLCRRPCLQLKP